MSASAGCCRKVCSPGIEGCAKAGLVGGKVDALEVQAVIEAGHVFDDLAIGFVGSADDELRGAFATRAAFAPVLVAGAASAREIILRVLRQNFKKTSAGFPVACCGVFHGLENQMRRFSNPWKTRFRLERRAWRAYLAHQTGAAHG